MSLVRHAFRVARGPTIRLASLAFHARPYSEKRAFGKARTARSAAQARFWRSCLVALSCFARSVATSFQANFNFAWRSGPHCSSRHSARPSASGFDLSWRLLHLAKAAVQYRPALRFGSARAGASPIGNNVRGHIHVNLGLVRPFDLGSEWGRRSSVLDAAFLWVCRRPRRFVSLGTGPEPPSCLRGARGTG